MELRWRKSLDYLSVGLPASPALDLSGEEEERGRVCVFFSKGKA